MLVYIFGFIPHETKFMFFTFKNVWKDFQNIAADHKVYVCLYLINDLKHFQNMASDHKVYVCLHFKTFLNHFQNS